MPPKNEIAIKDRNSNNRNDSNEYDNNFKNDINDDVTKFRFAK
jgi:hypothetical protein